MVCGRVERQHRPGEDFTPRERLREQCCVPCTTPCLDGPTDDESRVIAHSGKSHNPVLESAAVRACSSVVFESDSGGAFFLISATRALGAVGGILLFATAVLGHGIFVVPACMPPRRRFSGTSEPSVKWLTCSRRVSSAQTSSGWIPAFTQVMRR
jgi:hypothetical protein